MSINLYIYNFVFKINMSYSNQAGVVTMIH